VREGGGAAAAAEAGERKGKRPEEWK